jgi:hypothetical protein
LYEFGVDCDIGFIWACSEVYPFNTFLHYSHLHIELQNIPALKHSQYFLEHYDFLQLHPLFNTLILLLFSNISSAGA